MSTSIAKIIGIMGSAAATENALRNAYELGRQLAEEGYVVLMGGTNAGVMDAALKGAKSAGGLTIGILKDDHLNNMSPYVDIPIVTGLGSGRNNINVLTSCVIVACGDGIGTASEIAFALKANKDVILLNSSEECQHFFKSLRRHKVWIANQPAQVVNIIKELLL